MKRVSFLLFSYLFCFCVGHAQVIDYNDPIVEYDENNPPVKPPNGTLAKWVKTDGVSWNTTKWKAYYLNGVAFRLRFPNNYDPEKSYPLVVILHGLGFSNGTIYMNERHLNNAGAKAYEDGINSNKFDGFVLSPQSTGGWFSELYAEATKLFIEKASNDVSIDLNRISINGRSGGAQNTWLFISMHPQTYASSLPMAGIKNLAYDGIESYKHVPIWVFQGELDQGPSPASTENLIDAIINEGGNVRYTLFKNSGHGIFDKGYAEQDFFSYLERVNKTNPTVLTGEYTQVFDDNKKTVYEFLPREEPCPGDVVSVRLGVTAGFDEYEWRKDGQLMTVTTHEFTASELGTYEVRFRRGAEWSNWSANPIEIKLKDPTVTPDISVVGNASKVIPTLDDKTTVELELPQGFVEYEWRKVSENTLVGTERVFTAAEPGGYAAKVTEPFGCSSSFSNIFNVIDANGNNGPAELLEFNGFALSQSEAKLVWSTDPADPFPATGFEIYRALESDGLYEFIDLVDGLGSEFTLSGLTPNTDYLFKVRGVNDFGSTQSNEAILLKTLVDDVAPTAPSDLNVVTANTSNVSLSWTASFDNVAVYRYDIYKNGVRTFTTDTTSATVFNLQPNTIYKFTVKARDITGNESPESNRIVIATPLNSSALTNLKFNNSLTDEGSSNITSSLKGNTSFSSSTVKEGSYSLAFDGSNDYVDLDVGNEYIHDEFTERSIAFWMYPTSNTGIRDLFDEGGATNGIGIRLNGSSLELASQDNNNKVLISAPIEINQWTHVAGTFDNGQLTLYINGVLATQNSNVGYSAVSAHSDAAGLGATNGSNAFDVVSGDFSGYIDDFYLFDKAISASEITDLMSPPELVTIPDDNINAPSNIIATAQSHKQVLITWDDLSDNETGFQIYRAKDGSSYMPIASIPADSTSYIDNVVEPETKYSYYVIALGEFSQSQIPIADIIPSLMNLKFENGLSDDSGNNTSNVITGNLLFSNDFVQGTQSISFNGSSYVDLDRNNSFIHAPFNQRSIAFWFKSAGGVKQDIFDEGGATNGIGIRVLASNEVELAVQNSNDIFAVRGPFSVDVWHHVVGVFDNGNLAIYLDGVLLEERSDVSYATVNSHGNGGGLGGTNGSNAFDQVSSRFIGLVDDLYLFGVALDESEIGALIASVNPTNVATTLALPNPPVAPTNMTLANVTFTEATISFDDVSVDEEYFEVYRSVNTPDNFQLFATITDYNAPTVVFVDETLTTNITYYYQVAAVNDGGSSISPVLQVNTLNTVPELNVINSTTMQLGTTLEVQIQAVDDDNDPLTITISNLPDFGTFLDYGDGSALISFNPAANDDLGTYEDITVNASDGFGGLDSVIFSLIVNNNSVPTLTLIDDITIDENVEVVLAITAADLEGADNLIWTSELPHFVSLSTNADGSGSLNIAPGFSDHGSYLALITVTDQDGGSATSSFTLNVLDTDPNMFVQVNMRHTVNPPAGWNDVSNVNPVSLADINGNPTGISFDLLTSAWNSYNQGAQSSTGVFPNSVMKDYYYFGIFGAPETVEMELNGLDFTRTYNFSFLSSSEWTGTPDNGTTNFEINGQVVGVYAQSNTENTADFFGIQPTPEGKIQITMSKAAGTPVGYLNGFTFNSVLGSDEVPSAPRQLAGELNDNSVNLTWIDAPFNETGFEVYRSVNSTDNFVKINNNTLPSGTENYEDNDIQEGSTYYYQVTAVNSQGESEYSNQIEIVVPNTPPSINIESSINLYSNQVQTIQFTITDLPDNNFSFNVSGLPPFAAYDPGQYEIEFSPGQDDIGTYNFQIEATDNSNATSERSIELIVSEELLYVVSLNFSKNNNASTPWNNTAKNPANGDSFNNLIDQNGQPTDVDVSLLSAFGGVYNEGAITGNDSGVVPDAVLNEYYYFGIYGAPNNVQLKVGGLDFNNKYNFKFIGSSTFSGSGITDNGSTVYSIGNKSASLYVQGNTQNYAQIENVTASAQGEIFIDITKGLGASVGYINGMIIEAYPGEPTLYFPSELKANAYSTSSIELLWNDNSFDEDGFEVYRSDNGPDGDFTLIASLGPDADNYIDTDLSQGTIHYYKVRSVTGGTFSDYTNTAEGATIDFFVYVNINGVADYNEAEPWNNLGIELTTGDVVTGFKNNLGQETGIAMEVVNGMQGSNDWGVSTGDNSGVFPDKVIKSFYFNDRLEPAGQFKLLSLDLSFGYNLKFFGSIVTGFDIVTNFTANGETVSNYQTSNSTEVVSIRGITPDSEGSIPFSVQEAPSSTWAIFNAFVIEAYPSTASQGNTAARNAFGYEIVGNKEVTYGELSFTAHIWPNPVQDVLNLEITGLKNEDVQLTVYDVLGGLVLSEQVFVNDDNAKVSINELQNLKSGIYSIFLTSENDVIHQKFVKK